MLAAPARAEVQLSVTAAAGFDGFGKIGAYVPVTVWLTNQGGDISGDVIVRSNDANGFSVEYVSPAEVAQGAKKEIRFYVPINEMSSTMQVAFEADGGKVQSKAQINTLPYNEIIIGVLANDPTTMNHAAAIHLDNPVRSVRVVHLDEATLPDQQLVLNNFDLIVINDFDTTKLTKSQLDAIHGWVAEGGTLVVGGGPAWQKTLTGLPAEFLPVTVSGTAQISDFPGLAAEGGYPFQVLSPFTVSTGKLRDGATGVVSGDRLGRATMTYGDGRLVFFGVDLALDPVAAWRGNTALWQNLIAAAVPDGQNADIQYKLSSKMQRYRGGLANALRNIPALDLPPVWVLVTILICYIAIVGPLNYFVLKKRDRRDWGWVTIPSIALLAIGIVYFGAFKLKGREVMANEVAVVTLRPDLALQKIESYVGVFSPTRNDYQISLAGSQLVTNVPSYDGMYYDPSAMGDEMPLVMRVVYGTRTDVEFMNMSDWSMRSFTTQHYEAGVDGVEARLYGDGNRIAGTVTNKTAYVLKDCYLFTQNGFQSIGDLAPGATLDVDLSTTADPKSSNVAFYRLYNPAADFTPQPGKAPPIPSRDQIRKRMILDGAFEGSLEQGGQTNGVKFIGWTDQALSEPIVTAGRVTRSSLTLVTQSLAYTTWQNGRYSLPTGLINPSIFAQEGNEVGWYPGGFNVSNGSQLTVQFRLPEYRNVAIDSMAFHAYFDGSVSKTQQGTATLNVEIYDYARQAYEPMVLNSAAETPVPDPADHVSPDGAVLLRVKSSQGQWLNIQQLTISAQGREAR